jgi:hypothetical protein
MSTYRKFDWNRARRDFFTLFTDFFDYAAADWVITTTEAGAGSATEAVADAAGGILVVTNDAADNDLDAFQWAGGKGAVAETFKFTFGKKLHFVARVKLLEVLQADMMIGLWITDTDPVGGVTDGIYFRKSDGSAALSFVVEKNSSETVVATGVNMVADTFVDLEFYYAGGAAGSGKIDIYVGGTRVGSAVTTNAPDDEELALSFVVQNGEAVANVLSLDYIGASQER